MFRAQKSIYIVRHGQSIDNVLPVFQKSTSPLSEKGRFQARQIAQRIQHLDFAALISSPLPRAKETAEAISVATGKNIELSNLFVERIKPSSTDGKPWTDKAATKLFKAWEASLVQTGLKIEDGENFEEIFHRANQALEYLLSRTEDKMVVVSHGHFIRTLIAQILIGDRIDGEIAKRFYDLTSLENTAISVIQYREAFEEPPCWRVWSLNDHAHFAE